MHRHFLCGSNVAGSKRNLLFETEALTAVLRSTSLRSFSGQLADKSNVDVNFFADSQEKSAGIF